jgi:Ca2+/Na+ antiporter
LQHEFLKMMLNYIKEKIDAKNAELRAKPKPFSPAMEAALSPSKAGASEHEAEAEEEEEEEEEMPADLEHLSPSEQQVMIKRRAAMLCGLGTALILLFSDPMVEVFSNVGKRLAVPPFYIAFVMAPLASNASELIASLLYASKKSRKTITVSLSALEGAACMNNTFCLAIFMGLIYFKGLVWKFTAETCAILLVQLLVAGVALQHTQRLYHAILVLLLYPLSILFVAMVEARGLD